MTFFLFGTDYSQADQPETEPFLDEARNEMAILQHHDAITGTSPQKNTNDLFRRLFSANEALKAVVDKTFEKLLPKESSVKTIPKQMICDTINITECSVSVPKSVLNLNERKSIAKNELVFKANLVGIGFVTYFVKRMGE